MSKRSNSWIGVGLDAWTLGFESASVMGLRTLKLAAGGAAAQVEAQRMVSEKVEALVSLQTMALTGGLGLTPSRAASKSLKHYRRKVRANQRRLSRG